MLATMDGKAETANALLISTLIRVSLLLRCGDCLPYRNAPRGKHWKYAGCANSLFTWRELIAHLFLDQEAGIIEPPLLSDGDVYQFGVYTGDSLARLRTFFPQPWRFWGFDSFAGLPRDANDVQQKDWSKGSYKPALSKRLTMAHVVEAVGMPIQIIPGFFNVSLTNELVTRAMMGKAVYVDIDVDLYTSAKEALDFMLRNHLIVAGTVVGYDDWWVNPCSRGGELLHPLNTSEGRAHREISEKYSVRFRCLAGSCSWRFQEAEHCWGPVFIVEAVGDPKSAYHGFDMTPAQVQAWKHVQLFCRQVNDDTTIFEIQGG